MPQQRMIEDTAVIRTGRGGNVAWLPPVTGYMTCASPKAAGEKGQVETGSRYFLSVFTDECGPFPKRRRTSSALSPLQGWGTAAF